jgi:hypothetical protein
MNRENLSFLQDNLKYLGFGDNGPLLEQLEAQIVKESKEFQLFTEAYFDENSKIEAALYFRKGDLSDLYFFNKYQTLLLYPDNPALEKRQTFYINKGMGITFKEAFNLLQGRSVFKKLVSMDGEKYTAWVLLNFEEKDHHENYRMRQYGGRYGYDLEKVLEKYPILELQQEGMKAMLIKSLQKGNLQPVSFLKTNKTEKMMIEANPQYKTINIYPEASKVPARNNRKHLPPPMEEPAPDPVDPNRDGSGAEEEDLLEESTESLEPVTEKGLTRKKSRR